ncbi:MAG TPA: quinone oxidoreductase [Streptosporangiaceae bacterium]|nr:quinone oxidoreductase [Streptosporangiaceae bacterium]
MRAVLVSEHGGPGMLEIADVPAPEPGPGQLLVEVAAAGVNFADIYAREGRYPYAGRLPFVLGQEGAGTVAATGPGVTGFATGDRVAWTGVQGSYAEQAVLPAGAAVPVPDGTNLETAAAVLLQGMTAHYLCHSTFPVSQGDPVLVHAAAGGVGLLLTQLVKMRGGTVVATTSSLAKAVLAEQAGADFVAGYQDFGDVLRQVTRDSGAAVVYDGVGQATFEASLAALRPRGYLVLYGAASGPVPPFDLQRLNPAGSLFVTRPTLAHYVASREELLWRASDLFRWVREGQLSVRVGGRYPLSQAAQAQQDLAARRTTGKLLLLLPGGTVA